MHWIQNNFTVDYFARTNHARVARATAELEVIAFQILSDIEKLPLKAFSSERASLYGKVLSAMSERNRLLVESGMINKAAQKMEIAGPNGQPLNLDITNSTVEDRIAAFGATLPLLAENPVKPSQSA